MTSCDLVRSSSRHQYVRAHGIGQTLCSLNIICVPCVDLPLLRWGPLFRGPCLSTRTAFARLPLALLTIGFLVYLPIGLGLCAELLKKLCSGGFNAEGHLGHLRRGPLCLKHTSPPPPKKAPLPDWKPSHYTP